MFLLENEAENISTRMGEAIVFKRGGDVGEFVWDPSRTESHSFKHEAQLLVEPMGPPLHWGPPFTPLISNPELHIYGMRYS
jgi:hypothetical protein